MPGDDTTELKQQFTRIFGAGGRIHVVHAPGRVNVIGEHTDYNDGLVFPMAIEPHVRIACRGRSDDRVRLGSTAYAGAPVEFSLRGKIARADTDKGEPGWSNYCRGVGAELLAAGLPLTGMDALITHTLPIGGGLSSSAALEVATGLALLKLQEETIDPLRLALICQKAEHEYAHVPCGLMDQMIVACGKVGHAVLFDCRSMARQYVPIDSAELRVVIANSMVKHEHAGGQYAVRRRQCEQAAAYFTKLNPQVKALRDVTPADVQAAEGKLDPVIFRRARHVTSEDQRTTQAATLLGERRYEDLGALLLQSHASLRDDYEVSCPELDFLVAEAMKVKGVYGARLTGGGFGGCIIALVQPRSAEPLQTHLQKTYAAKYHKQPVTFATTATAAATVLE